MDFCMFLKLLWALSFFFGSFCEFLEVLACYIFFLFL